MKKDFEETLNEMSEIIKQQTDGVVSYVRQLKTCVENITTGSKAAEKNTETAAAATYLLMRLNQYKFSTTALSIISRKLERYVHNLVDECLDNLEKSEN